MSASKFFPRSTGNFVTRNEFLNTIGLLSEDIENLSIDISGILSDLSFGEANKVVFRDNSNDLNTDDLFGYDGETLTIGLETKTATFIPNLKLEVSGGVYLKGDVLINGSLDVMGDTTTINTINLDISANKITLNKGFSETGLPPTMMMESGFIIERGTEEDYHIFYKEACKSLHVGLSGEALFPLTEREEHMTEGSILVWTRRVGYPTCNGYLREVELNWNVNRLKIDNILDMSCNLIVDVSNILFCNGMNLLDRLDVIDVSISDIYNTLDVSFGDVYDRLDVVDVSISDIYNTLDVSFGDVYNRIDVVDVSISDLYDIKYDKTGGFINGNVSISGELDMCCNIIKDVSSIFVCGTNVRIGQRMGAIVDNSSIAIGIDAGQGQAENTVAIGHNAGRINQGKEAIAVGLDAGTENQGEDAIAFGQEAGSTDQGERALAFGYRAGSNNQGIHAIAIGDSAGRTNQSLYSLALGHNAGETDQSNNAIAIGRNTGRIRQGTGSIAIGHNAGYEDQHPRSIILNATDISLNTEGLERLYIKPIREKIDFDVSGILTYDASGEITNNTALYNALLDVCNNSVWERDTSGNIYYVPEVRVEARETYGYVGIGTTAPKRPIHLVQYTNGQTSIAFQQFNTTINQGSILSFRDASFVETGAIDFSRPVPVDVSRNKIGFFTRSNEFDGNLTENMSIDGITTKVRKIASFIESDSVDISDSVIIRGTLDMCCNTVIDVSGIYFCDGTYIGHGESFDISTNEVLKVYSNNGISQIINTAGDTLLLDGATRSNLTERGEKLQIHSLSAAGSAAGFYCYDAALSNSTRLEFYKNESGNILNNGDVSSNSSTLGFIGFQGRAGNAYLRGATIIASTEGTNVASGLRFATKGTTGVATERMRIDSLGNVGIGTVADNTYEGLTIFGTNPSVRLKSVGTSSWNWLEFVTSTNVNNYSFGVNQTAPSYFGLKVGAGMDGLNLYIDSSANVGIGTSTSTEKPEARLDVTDDTSGNVLFVKNIRPLNALGDVSNSYPVAYFAVKQVPDTFRGLEIGGPAGNVVGPVYLKVKGTSNRMGFFNDSNLENMTILSGGNIGIGTINPTNKLTIQNGNYSITDTGYALGITTNNFGMIMEVSGNIGSSAALWIKNDTPSAPVSTLFRVENNGNVAIGQIHNSSYPTQLQVNKYAIIGLENKTDFWGTSSPNAPSFWTQYGYFGTNGSFDLALSCNGYRNTSSGWTSLNVNSSTAAALVSLRPTDGSIRFCTSGAFPTGSAINPPERMRIDSSGNVGVGTIPTANRLEVGGNMNVTGNFSVSGTKAYRIQHPILSNYLLYNSAIEAPRCELIFRGKITMGQGIQLLSGNQQTTATVDLDSHSGYTNGTFIIITKNHQCFVSNESSFDAVRASITGNNLTIVVNKNNSTDVISWMVVAERNDNEIKQSGLVDGTGSLIPEHPKEAL